MSRSKTLFKIVDVTEGDDAYAPVVRAHGCDPWDREQLQAWVERRVYLDPRTMVVKELTGEELLGFFPEAMAKASHWGRTAERTLVQLTYREEPDFCVCDAGSCSDKCCETGDCDESCYTSCTCPEPPSPPDVLAEHQIVENYGTFLSWMTRHLNGASRDSPAAAMRDQLLRGMKERGLL